MTTTHHAPQSFPGSRSTDNATDAGKSTILGEGCDVACRSGAGALGVDASGADVAGIPSCAHDSDARAMGPHPCAYELEAGDDTDCLCGMAPSKDEERVVYDYDREHWACMECATQCCGCSKTGLKLEEHRLCQECRASGDWEWATSGNGPGWFRSEAHIQRLMATRKGRHRTPDEVEADLENRWAHHVGRALGMGTRKESA